MVSPARPNVSDIQLQWPSKHLPALQDEDGTKDILISLHRYENATIPSMDIKRHSAVDRSTTKFEDGIARAEAERKCKS